MLNTPSSVADAPATTGPAGVLRDPEKPVRYRLAERWADMWAGLRDGRCDGKALADLDADTAPLCAAVWLAGNQHLFADRDRREFLAAQTAAAPMITRLQVAIAAAAQSAAAAQQARSLRAGLSTGPAANELARRGPGEATATDSAIAARRRAAHKRTLAAADAAATRAEEQARGLAEQAEAIRVELDSLFQITRTRSDQLREHHQRRATTFLRTYRRTVSNRLGHTPSGTSVLSEIIPAPQWTTQPCPWTSPAREITASA